MKRMHGSARTLGPCILMAILPAGPAIAKTDAVLDWNEIAVNTTIGQNPFAQARYAAIVQLTVFEAVNAVSGDYRRYLGSIVAPMALQPTQQPSRLPIGCSVLISRPALPCKC
jgi:hypothetical protein